MASSTTIPSVRMKPNRLIMFTVTPRPGIIRNAPKKRHREPGGCPDREPAGKGEEKDQEDECESLKPVPHQDIHPAFEELPGIEPGPDRKSFRERGCDLAELRVDRTRGLEQARFLSQHHFEQDRGLPVHPCRPLDVLKAVSHRRDIPDRDDPASRSRNQWNPGKFISGGGFRRGAHAQLPEVGPDGAPGMSAEPRRIAAATWSKVSPNRVRTSSATSIEIS